MSDNKQVLDKIMNNLNQMRVFIQNEGGDVNFVSFENGILTLIVSGHCIGCSSFDTTYTYGIKGILMDTIPEIKDVVFTLKKTA